MNHGQICARYIVTGQSVRLRWEGAQITRIESAPPTAAEDLWIAPALIDLQINGFGGVDFQRDGLGLDDLLSATRQLQAAGCAQFLLTLITDEWTRLRERLRRLRALRAQSPELQHAIAGWHIEGPFLSAEPGFCGAHDPASMCDPTPTHIRELRTIVGPDPVLLTLAPERSGALAAIELGVSLGLKVSLGHTNASADILCRAIQAGATGFTHLANGCLRELDRHDNILWRVFEAPTQSVSLIPDCIHISPALFRLIHRLLPPETIYYTTDAMAAAGAPPGRYTIGRLEVEVGPEQVVRQPGKTNFAGSALRPVEGVFRAAQMLNCRWQLAWTRFSQKPAQFMGWDLEFARGRPADFCLLKTTGDNQLDQLQVYVRGELKYQGAITFHGPLAPGRGQ
jgi:N-acetylglucosamine-6-phosphate deacetylase